METCAGCLSTFADFGHIAEHLLDFAGTRRHSVPPAGMTSRFIARAHSEGIPLAKKNDDRVSEHHLLRYSVYLGLLAALLILFAKVILLHWGWHFRVPNIAIKDAPSAPNQKPNAPPDNAVLEQQLEVLRNQLNQVEAEVESDRRRLQSAQSEKLASSARLAELEKHDQDLRQSIAGRDARITELTAEATRTKEQVDHLLSAKAADEFRLRADQGELNDLRTTITTLNAKMDDSQQLSTAAEEAQDLIVARKLHIVDVDDTDGSGKRQRPFGRIFYAEGHKLVFYAYDLPDSRKLSAKINFYLWGSQEGVNKPVRSLGIFRTDDAKEARWVVNFDDPAVLAQINCVFVTAESNKRPVTEPTGHQLLFASLGPKANHP